MGRGSKRGKRTYGYAYKYDPEGVKADMKRGRPGAGCPLSAETSTRSGFGPSKKADMARWGEADIVQEESGRAGGSYYRTPRVPLSRVRGLRSACWVCSRKLPLQLLAACVNPFRPPRRWVILCERCRGSRGAWYGVHLDALTHPAHRARLDAHVRSKRWFAGTKGWDEILEALEGVLR